MSLCSFNESLITVLVLCFFCAVDLCCTSVLQCFQ